jgi:hypothetical protein
MRMFKLGNMRWVGLVAHTREMENVCKILVEEPEGKRSVGRPRRRWEDNFEMELREVSLEGVDWVHLTQDKGLWCALVKTVLNLRVS